MKAIMDLIDTFLEFFLSMFGVDKEKGEKGGIDMLKKVMSNLIDSLVESLKSIFEGIRNWKDDNFCVSSSLRDPYKR